MKRVFFLGLIGLLLSGCGSAKTKLDFQIVSHPVGGTNIEAVSCRFTGQLEPYGGGLFGSKSVTPVTVTAEWWWSNYFGQDQSLVGSGSFTFRDEQTVEDTIAYQAPSGYILLNYYWVRFRWSDDTGEHAQDSHAAFCSPGMRTAQGGFDRLPFGKRQQ